MQKHKKEREAHNKRTQTAMTELEKEKSKKIDKLKQECNNVKKQTENAQKIELAQLSKAEKKGSLQKVPISGGNSGMIESSPAKGS